MSLKDKLKEWKFGYNCVKYGVRDMKYIMKSSIEMNYGLEDSMGMVFLHAYTKGGEYLPEKLDATSGDGLRMVNVLKKAVESSKKNNDRAYGILKKISKKETWQKQVDESYAQMQKNTQFNDFVEHFSNDDVYRGDLYNMYKNELLPKIETARKKKTVGVMQHISHAIKKKPLIVVTDDDGNEQTLEEFGKRMK